MAILFEGSHSGIFDSFWKHLGDSSIAECIFKVICLGGPVVGVGQQNNADPCFVKERIGLISKLVSQVGISGDDEEVPRFYKPHHSRSI